MLKNIRVVDIAFLSNEKNKINRITKRCHLMGIGVFLQDELPTVSISNCQLTRCVT